MEGMGINYKLWKGKRVLVTGHTGFKGTWLSIWLDKIGAKVIGYSLEKYPNDKFFCDCNLGEKIIDIRGDILNFKKLKQVFDEYEPDFVFHLAAQPLVRESYDKPLETFKTNVVGTLNVLDCVRNSKVSSALFITSDKVYKNKEQIWGYREDDTIGGDDPYSCSKGCDELIVASYRKSFFKQEGRFVATARAGNIIGGGDWSKDRLIPDCVRALEKKIPIGIRNPDSLRPWQHVLEPLLGYILIAQNLLLKRRGFDCAWNLGPPNYQILSVKDVVMRFISEWGEGALEDISNPNEKKHETKLLNLDISQSLFNLEWHPKLDLNETIKLTVEWYKNKTNPYGLCLKQIDYYEKK